jgi:hypothetical protein
MDKNELIRKVESMTQDLNFYLNSKKGDEKQRYAWEYSREYILIILKLIRNLD